MFLFDSVNHKLRTGLLAWPTNGAIGREPKKGVLCFFDRWLRECQAQRPGSRREPGGCLEGPTDGLGTLGGSGSARLEQRTGQALGDVWCPQTLFFGCHVGCLKAPRSLSDLFYVWGM